MTFTEFLVCMIRSFFFTEALCVCVFLQQAVSPDGEAIVTGAGDETLRFWNVFSKTRCTKVRHTYKVEKLNIAISDLPTVMHFE